MKKIKTNDKIKLGNFLYLVKNKRNRQYSFILRKREMMNVGLSPRNILNIYLSPKQIKKQNSKPL